MPQDHSLIKAQEALWKFEREIVWEQTKWVLNSAFLIFEKIRIKMAHLFALYVTDQFASRVI